MHVKYLKVFTYAILFSLIRKSENNITSFTSRDCDAQYVESIQGDEPTQLLATSLALKILHTPHHCIADPLHDASYLAVHAHSVC